MGDYDYKDDRDNKECSGNCDNCPHKYFDSMESYEFVCDITGHEV